MPDETTTPGRSKEFWKHPLVVNIVGAIVAGVILFLVLSPWQDDPSDDPGTATSGPSGPTTTAPPPGKSTTTPTSGPSTAGPPGTGDTTFLSELGDQLAGIDKVGPAAIGGTEYPNSVTIKCLYGGDRAVPVSYQLGGRFKRLVAQLGIDDATDQPGAVGSVTITSVLGTTRDQLQRARATKDTATPIDVDVTGVKTLELVCTPNEGHQGFFNVTLGDATLSA